jgi:hypothetical protein
MLALYAHETTLTSTIRIALMAAVTRSTSGRIIRRGVMEVLLSRQRHLRRALLTNPTPVPPEPAKLKPVCCVMLVRFHLAGLQSSKHGRAYLTVSARSARGANRFGRPEDPSSRAAMPAPCFRLFSLLCGLETFRSRTWQCSVVGNISKSPWTPSQWLVTAVGQPCVSTRSRYPFPKLGFTYSRGNSDAISLFQMPVSVDMSASSLSLQRALASTTWLARNVCPVTSPPRMAREPARCVLPTHLPMSPDDPSANSVLPTNGLPLDHPVASRRYLVQTATTTPSSPLAPTCVSSR